MVNPMLIKDVAISGYKAAKRCKEEISKDPYTPELNKLRKEGEKWTIAVNIIGRECPHIGDTTYEIEWNAINYLSAIEGVVTSCARYNILLPQKVYVHTDASRIKEIKVQNKEDLIERIYPMPQEAIASLEEVVNDYIAGSKDYGYIESFEQRKNGIIGELVQLKKKIIAPYKPGQEYTSIQKDLAQTAKKMAGIEYDYIMQAEKLEHKRTIHRLKVATKVAVTAGITIAVSMLVSSKLKIQKK